jgi:xanthine dehydrogenase small subunit
LPFANSGASGHSAVARDSEGDSVCNAGRNTAREDAPFSARSRLVHHGRDERILASHMAMVVFEMNGQSVIVNDVDPHCTLLEWLRASGRTGTKEGCAEGECGACAVAFVSRDVHGRPQLEAVNSCLVALPEVHGRSVVSVEGLARSAGPLQPAPLHPVQEVMAEAGGSQCGYCTPGFVMSLFAEYYRPGRSDYDPESISGNLCRCTGYRPIVDAARKLRPPPVDDPWLLRLDRAPALPALEYMANGHRFLRPSSLPDVFDALERYPDAVLLGGGTDLMVYSNQRYTRYATLVSLAGVAELQTLSWGNGQGGHDEITLGAGVPLSHLERALEGVRAGELRLLHEVLPLFSSRLIRNRATLGGNLGTASPIGDSPPVLLALGAELTLASKGGVRRLSLSDYFIGYRKTALVPGELILSVHIPRPLPRVQRFYKVSKRVMDDISSVAAAFALDLDAAGRVERLQIAYGGIAAIPLRAHALERLAAGRLWDGDTLRLLQQASRQIGTPLSDHRASADYRRAMISSLLERFFWDTTTREEAAE